MRDFLQRAGSNACPHQAEEDVFSFFGRKKKQAKKLAQALPVPAQKRTSYRMPVRFDLTYSLVGRLGRRSGRAHDISAGGLRLETDEDLIAGSIVEVDFQLPDTSEAFAPMRLRAKILATYFDTESNKLTHGAMFVNAEPKTEEALRRYVHLWQLSRIRERKAVP